MEENREQLFEFRSYQADDVNFIHDSWKKSYYEWGTGHNLLGFSSFDTYHRPIRDKILNNPNVAIVMASAAKDPSTILGWIAVEKPNTSDYTLLHYIYIKASVLGEGIATDLVNRTVHIKPVLYTHSTVKARRIIRDNWRAEKNYFDLWHYTPHLI